MVRVKTGDAACDWLLERQDPGVRYLALRDLVQAGPKELATARKKAHTEGPIRGILDNMKEPGYWDKPGPGYAHKYIGTVWSMISLAQLGGSIETDRRIGAACKYLLDHALTSGGQFTVNGTPSGTIDCLQGNLLAALLDLGCEDKRLEKAFEWMARSETGEGVAPMEEHDAPVRYYMYKRGPRFECSGNYKQSCAWGAVKVMLAFGKLPKQKHTPSIDSAIEEGARFLLGTDPADADYPSGINAQPSGNWWKFGFPVFYVTDLLQNVEALVSLGYGQDPRLARALALIAGKADAEGRWPLEYNYAGKIWVDFGKKRQPNKWVTLRARRALAAAG